jgi:hypothetical protein
MKDWEAFASWLAEASLSSTSLPKAHDLSSSATAPILRCATLGGESERVFFAFFTLVYRKHTFISIRSSLVILPGEFSTSESRSAHASMQPSPFRIEFIELIGA